LSIVTPPSSRARARLLVVILVTCCALVFGVSKAWAYTLEYYLGTPSNPVHVNSGGGGGVNGSTSDAAFRLFNEATALSSGQPMWIVTLYYNYNHSLGTAVNTYYYYVYQNGSNATAQCTIGSPGSGTTYVYCDTSR